ncbi:multicopper oxidase family protein [Rhodopila globiformis]|uniref:Copper oxidase n=1 Tax=Rhodopila globiformis TaxID=1071 RepID=A0A2S6NHY8_RHOGL|nr:multicopper oxidase domain-containing protein [Rhodopila globiformis]PPQ34255.1 copper oxidase [Rhodopila globiformis]
MPVERRTLLKLGGISLIGIPGIRPALAQAAAAPRPDYTIDIGHGLAELAPDQIISTTLYNGQFPGPLLRFHEGRETTVDIRNNTDHPEVLHWHGQKIPVAVDGAMEEGTPLIPPGGTVRETFTPGPSGFRFYHTHMRAGSDLSRGQYSGLVGPVYIEPKQNPGAYDQEIFLVLKEFGPTFSRGGDMDMDFLAGAEIQSLKDAGEAAMQASLKRGQPKGYEVGYQFFTINGRMLGHGEPIRVRQGQRVLFHILNGSATEIRSLAMAGHSFRVVAMDGNPVAHPAEVPVLWIGTAERISAVVEMNHPGVFILGDLADDDRAHGMGIVVEYAGSGGKPQWQAPPPFKWDYTLFGTSQPAAQPDHVFDMVFAKHNAAANGFNRWTINGTAYPDTMRPQPPILHLAAGRRYRLHLRNQSDDIHPIHLHRHSFELTRIAGKPTSGVIKDVVMLGGYQEAEVDFVADDPGATLFHCHQQLHMDFGFMALFDYENPV